MRTMGDSTSPADIPADVDMVALYIDGRYVATAADRERFAGKPILGIATSAWSQAGDVLDVESGDATPAQAPGWVNSRHAAGVARPTVYCNRGNEGAVDAALHAAAVDTRVACIWIATLDGTELQGLTAHGYPIVACQRDGSAQTGGHWDRSVVYDDTWHGAAPPAPAPPQHWEDPMTPQRATVHIEGNRGWITPPDPTAIDRVVNVVVDTQAPDEAGRYVPVPSFVGVSTDRSRLVFGQGGDGPCPDGDYGCTVWLAG